MSFYESTVLLKLLTAAVIGVLDVEDEASMLLLISRLGLKRSAATSAFSSVLY
jgi:hypothetical protein